MKLIPIIQKINRIKRDISENQTLISTILPVLRYLGWDIFNENRVLFEDVTTTKKRVDITLIFENGDKFIIEAKRLSHKLSIKDFEQLTSYINSDDSVNFGILTNGIDYWIADNKASGLENKKIYGFNLFDMTECDLNVLRLFFSFNTPHKMRDLNRYIEYIKTGIDFGDKKCEKVLDISNFEAEKEIKFQTSEEIHSESSSKKPQFDLPFDETDKSSEATETTESKEIEESELEITDSDDEDKIADTSIEDDKSSDDSPEANLGLPVNVEVFKPEEEEQSIEFFELIERNRAKIYLNGEYHIISDESFSTLFVQMLKYTLHNIESYPALYNKVVTEFDFLVQEDEKSNKSAKYEQVAETIFYNVNITNYVKLKNIETLLKFIHTNLE
jgi:predicted type IV restriction endonuclease